MRKVFAEKAQDFPQCKLTASSWELESDALRLLRDKIVSGKKTLKEVYGSPLYSIKTGLNEAFVIDRATRDRLIAEDPKSEELLKPWLEGKDLKRWRAESRDLYIILIPKGWTKSRKIAADETVAWKWLEQERPAIARQLSQFAEQARKRTDQGDYWWELRACDYYPEFEKPKIIYNRFLSEPRFYLDNSGGLINDAPYFIPVDRYELLGLLNSNLFWYTVASRATALSGGYFQLHAQYVETFFVPEIGELAVRQLTDLTENCQKIALTRIGIQQNLARRIPDLCPAGREAKLSTKLHDWWQLPDFAAFRAEVKKCFKAEIPLSERNAWEDLFTTSKAEITNLSAQIKRNEDEINAIVYKLFDLNPDEIKLLEESIGIK